MAQMGVVGINTFAPAPIYVYVLFCAVLCCARTLKLHSDV
jgi:hypothetical protein